MINKIIYFLHRYICCHFIIYLPHNILATTLLLYTERQNKNIYIYTLLSYFLFWFFFLFSFFVVNVSKKCFKQCKKQ